MKKARVENGGLRASLTLLDEKRGRISIIYPLTDKYRELVRELLKNILEAETPEDGQSPEESVG